MVVGENWLGEIDEFRKLLEFLEEKFENHPFLWGKIIIVVAFAVAIAFGRFPFDIFAAQMALLVTFCVLFIQKIFKILKPIKG